LNQIKKYTLKFRNADTDKMATLGGFRYDDGRSGCGVRVEMIDEVVHPSCGKRRMKASVSIPGIKDYEPIVIVDSRSLIERMATGTCNFFKHAMKISFIVRLNRDARTFVTVLRSYCIESIAHFR
jgi:hypothetical protein